MTKLEENRVVINEMLLCPYCRVLVPYTIKSEKRTTSYNVTYIRKYGECDICHKEIMVPGLDDENSRTLDAEIEKISEVLEDGNDD